MLTYWRVRSASNSRDASPLCVIQRLDLIKKITRDVKLKEVTDFPVGRTTGDTRSGFWNEMLGVEGDLPLDRVFFGGFTPTSARVLNYDTSDHRPIMVKLKLQNQNQ